MSRDVWQISSVRRFSSRRARWMARGSVLFVAAFLLFLLAARSFADVHAVRADEPAARITQMTVSVFPEYDEPGVLTIYQGEIEGARSFPTEVRFRVPRGADVREVCAIRRSDREHLCQLFETLVAGDDLMVTYDIPLPTFFLEFYFADTAGARNLEYAFRSESPVERLELVVQHPLRASNFTLTPAGSAVSGDDRGFLYHHYTYQDVAPGQPLEVKIAYQKDDQEPSVPKKLAAIVPAPRDDERKELFLLGTGLLLTAALVAAIYVVMDRFGTGRIEVVRSVRAEDDLCKMISSSSAAAPAQRGKCPEPNETPREG